MTGDVRYAAGYVLWRREAQGHCYLLLRNAGHGTWGFPKGHRDGDERDEECARRELREETGLEDVAVDVEFDRTVSYVVTGRDGEGIPKKVRYFLAELLSGEVVRSAEHDRVGWLSYTEGRRILEHALSRDLLDAAEARVAEIMRR